jgi:hypothetical protein
MIRIFCLLAAAIPQLAFAQERLFGDAFEAYTQGKTMYFSRGGQVYGAEQYLPGGRVLWSFLDGTCNDGSWFSQDEQICFYYDNSGGAQCWDVTLGEHGLTVTFSDDERPMELKEIPGLSEPLDCPGPMIGA